MSSNTQRGGALLWIIIVIVILVIGYFAMSGGEEVQEGSDVEVPDSVENTGDGNDSGDAMQGDAMDKDLYDLPADELAEIPTVCGSLREALDSLKTDHEFLLKGDVFTKDAIDAYIELKMEEVLTYETMPHPIEFLMYYSA